MGLADKLADQLQAEFIAPRDAMEQAIAAVIQELLKCDRLSITENFFVLGGDSLKGTQVMSRLSAQFGIELPNTLLFRYPTVMELAMAVRPLIAADTADNGVVNDLMAQLAGLPPEEIERLLAEIGA
jgi:acyl carrier protein